MSKTITLTNAEHEDILEALDLLHNSRRALNATYGETVYPVSNLTELENLTNRISQTQDGFASIWTLDDVLDMIKEDAALHDVDPESISRIASFFFASIQSGLSDVLRHRGNAYILDMWQMRRDRIMKMYAAEQASNAD
jgi:hypothetical protein